jgi:hypothetical protein
VSVALAAWRWKTYWASTKVDHDVEVCILQHLGGSNGMAGCMAAP